MVVLNKIYTRTGDKGTTALGTGERVPKHTCASRPMAPWTKPTPPSAWPVSTSASSHPGVDAKLARIQNDLFDLGADLCVPDRGEKLRAMSRCASPSPRSKRLEAEIDEMNAELKPLRPSYCRADRPLPPLFTSPARSPGAPNG